MRAIAADQPGVTTQRLQRYGSMAPSLRYRRHGRGEGFGLSGANLHFANLSGADLSGADLHLATLNPSAGRTFQIGHLRRKRSGFVDRRNHYVI